MVWTLTILLIKYVNLFIFVSIDTKLKTGNNQNLSKNKLFLKVLFPLVNVVVVVAICVAN